MCQLTPVAVLKKMRKSNQAGSVQKSGQDLTDDPNYAMCDVLG